MLVVYRWRAVAHEEHQNTRAEEEQHRKVQVMNPTDKSGAFRGNQTAAGSKVELRSDATQPHHQAAHQAPECPLTEGTGGKDQSDRPLPVFPYHLK